MRDIGGNLVQVKDVLPERPVDIMVRVNAPAWSIHEDMLFGYCKWDGERLISLDGDSYSTEDEITKYKHEDDGTMTYWIAAEWQ